MFCYAHYESFFLVGAAREMSSVGFSVWMKREECFVLFRCLARVGVIVMAGVGNLFSAAKKDQALVGLFNDSAAGPVKRTITQRTTIKVAPKKQDDTSVDGGESREEGDEEQEDEDAEAPTPLKKQKKKRGGDDDENADLEARYLEKILDKDEPAEEEATKEDAGDSDSDSDSEPETPEAKVKVSSAKTLDLKQEEVEKAERTVFVGNLNVSTITKKADYKAFKKLFVQHGPVESIRFRSIAFSEPLPRKAAFVKQSLNSTRDSVNAYVVFKDKASARKALDLNGSQLLGLHLRVDSVSHPAKVDNKRCIFVGNLDFEETEEELWKIFGECGDIESVRIVRDSKTNFGKGFGYVQFKDSVTVDRALLLNGKKLGSKKRQLRITRSKRMRPQQSLHKSLNAAKNLTDDQKTRLGRAKRVLGKADRSQAGKVIEGTRAKKGDRVTGIKNGKGRVKKPRHTKRSTEFKKMRDAK